MLTGLVAGFAMSGVGLHMAQQAQASQLDAINVYNDAMIEALLVEGGPDASDEPANAAPIGPEGGGAPAPPGGAPGGPQ